MGWVSPGRLKYSYGANDHEFWKLGNLCLDGTAVVAHPVGRAIVRVCERSLVVGGRTVAFNMVIIIVVVVWEAFQ